MTTHKEEIDVPDGMTIHRGGDSPIEFNCICFMLKPLSPPEPPIKPCFSCGGDLETLLLIDGRFKIRHAYTVGNCHIQHDGLYFPTRAEAIAAANRRG